MHNIFSLLLFISRPPGYSGLLFSCLASVFVTFAWVYGMSRSIRQGDDLLLGDLTIGEFLKQSSGSISIMMVCSLVLGAMPTGWLLPVLTILITQISFIRSKK